MQSRTKLGFIHGGLISKFGVALVSSAILLMSGCRRDPIKVAEKSLAQAERAVNENKPDEAALLYRKAIQNNPKLFAAHFNLAKLYLDRKNYAGGFHELQASLKLNPESQEARETLARLYLSTRRYSEARTESETLLAADPENQGALLVLAEAARGMSDLRTAHAAIDKILAQDEKNEQALLLLAELNEQSGRPQEAEATLRALVAFHPDWVPGVAALSAKFDARKDYSAAEAVIRQVLSYNPESIEANYLLGRFLWSRQQINDAEKIFRRIATLGEKNPADRGALALFHVLSNRGEEAEQEYRQIAEHHPDDSLNLRRLAILYFVNGKSVDAVEVTTKVLKNNASDPETLLLRGLFRVRSGQLSEGIQDLQRIVQIRPEIGLPHYYLALAFQKQGDSGLAESQAREAVRLNPDLTIARMLLAQMELQSGDRDHALDDLKRVIASKPPVLQPYVMHSVALAETGNLLEAEKDLLPLLEVFSQPDARALMYRTLAWIKFRDHNYIESRRLTQQALEVEPESREAFELLAMTFVAEKHLDRGIPAITTYMQAHPAWGPGSDIAARTMIMDRRYDDARKFFEQALGSDPGDLVAEVGLADIAILQAKFDEALQRFTRLADNHPKDAVYQIRLGQICEHLANYEGAKQHYESALHLSPNDALAKNNLAWLYSEQGGNLDVALRLAQEAKNAQPEDPAVSDTLGWIYLKKDSVGNAIELLRKSVEQQPQSALYQYHLGAAYLRAGKSAEARHSLQAALRLQKEFSGEEDAKRLLSQLAN